MKTIPQLLKVIVAWLLLQQGYHFYLCWFQTTQWSQEVPTGKRPPIDIDYCWFSERKLGVFSGLDQGSGHSKRYFSYTINNVTKMIWYFYIRYFETKNPFLPVNLQIRREIMLLPTNGWCLLENLWVKWK